MKKMIIYIIIGIVVVLVFGLFIYKYYSSKSNRPEKFFTGSALDMGQAILKEDVESIRKSASSADINKVYMHDMTFLYFALMNNRSRAVTELLKLGANPKQIDEELGSPLDYAVRLNNPGLLSAMLDAGISPNELNSWGTPLIFTAVDNMEMLKLLVEKGANINIKDGGIGRTALIEAFLRTNYDQVIYLIENGADVNITLTNGVTFAHSFLRKFEQQSIDTNTPAYKKLLEIKGLLEVRGVKFTK